MRDRWNIWFVTYAPLAEALVDIPPRLSARDLPFDEARRVVERAGFGYCMKPAQESKHG